MFSLVLIALCLSMDAFAVSVSSGICIKKLKAFHIIRASLFFGFFQFLMPVLGWFLGSAFNSLIENYKPWIAFVLLSFIGGKMIKEGWTAKASCPAEPGKPNNPAETFPADSEAAAGKKGPQDIRNLPTLFALAVATSIDALTVGLSLSVLGMGIWLPAGIIGGITFVLCMVGFEFGRRIGFLFEKYAQIAAGIILIILGIRILAEHLLSLIPA